MKDWLILGTLASHHFIFVQLLLHL